MRAVFAVFLAFPLLAQTPNSLSPKEKADGWILLFNGNNLDNWRIDFPAVASVWSAKDGWIQCTPPGHIGHDLLSREEFKNFDLTFEWKTAKASNSGVKYRIQGTGTWIMRDDGKETAFVERNWRKKKLVGSIGFEYQVVDDENNKDAKRGAKWASGALYDLKPATKAHPAVAEKIHQGRIVLKGMHFEHWLDGEKVVEGELNDPAFFADNHEARRSEIVAALKEHRETVSPIALQYHEDPVSFRNLKIRRLPD
jgi:hypothetical protein